ncbi:hypothetical protein OG921_24030 [Aldersonia sp. NBC_00410]|uniref:hypothetical protein n=1 Tax=Aldersonia sp. NBC_00410 TaxID=2975954 RepID=UPI0022510F12|nr:hypothetical protein [Aldersonia sp. NBC_00410]MCX5046245.1 hypothetical protein [Aldersonia sp. NBC_00410]
MPQLVDAEVGEGGIEFVADIEWDVEQHGVAPPQPNLDKSLLFDLGAGILKAFGQFPQRDLIVGAASHIEDGPQGVAATTQGGGTLAGQTTDKQISDVAAPPDMGLQTLDESRRPAGVHDDHGPRPRDNDKTFYQGVAETLRGDSRRLYVFRASCVGKCGPIAVGPAVTYPVQDRVWVRRCDPFSQTVVDGIAAAIDHLGGPLHDLAVEIGQDFGDSSDLLLDVERLMPLIDILTDCDRKQFGTLVNTQRWFPGSAKTSWVTAETALPSILIR